MNREIKFRGKRTNIQEWVYGFYFGNYDPTKEEDIICDAFIYDGLRNLSRAIPVIPETVGQYTGLKDKNGKEIYEGDICKAKYAGGNGDIYTNEIKWDGCGLR